MLRNTLLTAGLVLFHAGATNAQDYNDFSWIKNWAAVGDSFTAAIGSGNLYSTDSSDKACSRYDYGYPAIMNRFFGNSVEKFSYLACSGDTSTDIAGQIEALDSGQDLVVMTAGGNDLCLSGIIAACILSPFTSQSKCQASISYAQTGIDTYLGENIQTLLESLDEKMNDGGVVVFNYYAKYFNVENDDCATKNNWAWPLGTSLPLTTDLREQLNTLVDNTNAALKKAVEAANVSKMTLVAADWDPYVTAVKGQFCEPGASPSPIDPSNDDVMFFKLDTTVPQYHDELKRRDYWDIVQNQTAHDTITVEEALWAEAQIDHELDLRDVTAPNCGNAVLKNLLSFLMTDSIGKIFHPNELGHEIIASFALNAVREGRSKVLDISAPTCAVSTGPTCYQKSGSKAYASSYALYSNTAAFCSEVGSNYPTNTANWHYSKTFNTGTVDENTFEISLSNGATTFNEDQCNKAVNLILDGCDGNDPANPMNWKFGGELVEGSYTYTISMTRTNRPFPVPTAPTQTCTSWYKVFFDQYDIYGAGWATWDYGQSSLRPNSTSCFGLGITGWNFEYYDAPDKNGNEWHAWFKSPIWTRARCYNNNKVQSSAGGPSSGGCSGNG